tara:strand:- start:663 stop:5564 length:4902 start_codon:yes stop_codon:yes gene_type:complete
MRADLFIDTRNLDLSSAERTRGTLDIFNINQDIREIKSLTLAHLYVPNYILNYSTLKIKTDFFDDKGLLDKDKKGDMSVSKLFAVIYKQVPLESLIYEFINTSSLLANKYCALSANDGKDEGRLLYFTSRNDLLLYSLTITRPLITYSDIYVSLEKMALVSTVKDGDSVKEASYTFLTNSNYRIHFEGDIRASVPTNSTLTTEEERLLKDSLKIEESENNLSVAYYKFNVEQSLQWCTSKLVRHEFLQGTLAAQLENHRLCGSFLAQASSPTLQVKKSFSREFAEETHITYTYQAISTIPVNKIIYDTDLYVYVGYQNTIGVNTEITIANGEEFDGTYTVAAKERISGNSGMIYPDAEYCILTITSPTLPSLPKITTHQIAVKEISRSGTVATAIVDTTHGIKKIGASKVTISGANEVDFNVTDADVDITSVTSTSFNFTIPAGAVVNATADIGLIASFSGDSSPDGVQKGSTTLTYANYSSIIETGMQLTLQDSTASAIVTVSDSSVIKNEFGAITFASFTYVIGGNHTVDPLVTAPFNVHYDTRELFEPLGNLTTPNKDVKLWRSIDLGDAYEDDDKLTKVDLKYILQGSLIKINEKKYKLRGSINTSTYDGIFLQQLATGNNRVVLSRQGVEDLLHYNVKVLNFLDQTSTNNYVEIVLLFDRTVPNASVDPSGINIENTYNLYFNPFYFSYSDPLYPGSDFGRKIDVVNGANVMFIDTDAIDFTWNVESMSIVGNNVRMEIEKVRENIVVSSLESDNVLAKVTVSSPDLFGKIGEYVTIKGASDPGYNGTFKTDLTSFSYTSPYTFQYFHENGSMMASESGGGIEVGTSHNFKVGDEIFIKIYGPAANRGVSKEYRDYLALMNQGNLVKINNISSLTGDKDIVTYSAPIQKEGEIFPPGGIGSVILPHTLTSKERIEIKKPLYPDQSNSDNPKAKINNVKFQVSAVTPRSIWLAPLVVNISSLTSVGTPGFAVHALATSNDHGLTEGEKVRITGVTGSLASKTAYMHDNEYITIHTVTKDEFRYDLKYWSSYTPGALQNIDVGDGNDYSTSQSLDISSITHSSTTATATMALGLHNIVDGMMVTISGVTGDAAYNGQFVVSNVNEINNQFDYTMDSIPSSDATNTGIKVATEVIDEFPLGVIEARKKTFCPFTRGRLLYIPPEDEGYHLTFDYDPTSADPPNFNDVFGNTRDVNGLTVERKDLFLHNVNYRVHYMAESLLKSVYNYISYSCDYNLAYLQKQYYESSCCDATTTNKRGLLIKELRTKIHEPGGSSKITLAKKATIIDTLGQSSGDNVSYSENMQHTPKTKVRRFQKYLNDVLNYIETRKNNLKNIKYTYLDDDWANSFVVQVRLHEANVSEEDFTDILNLPDIREMTGVVNLDDINKSTYLPCYYPMEKDLQDGEYIYLYDNFCSLDRFYISDQRENIRYDYVARGVWSLNFPDELPNCKIKLRYFPYNAEVKNDNKVAFRDATYDILSNAKREVQVKFNYGDASHEFTVMEDVNKTISSFNLLPPWLQSDNDAKNMLVRIPKGVPMQLSIKFTNNIYDNGTLIQNKNLKIEDIGAINVSLLMDKVEFTSLTLQDLYYNRPAKDVSVTMNNMQLKFFNAEDRMYPILFHDDVSLKLEFESA